MSVHAYAHVIVRVRWYMCKSVYDVLLTTQHHTSRSGDLVHSSAKATSLWTSFDCRSVAIFVILVCDVMEEQ